MTDYSGHVREHGMPPTVLGMSADETLALLEEIDFDLGELSRRGVPEDVLDRLLAWSDPSAPAGDRAEQIEIATGRSPRGDVEIVPA